MLSSSRILSAFCRRLPAGPWAAWTYPGNGASVPGVFQLLAHRLLHGALWSTLGVACSRLLTLAAFILAARRLGVEAYGEVGLIQSTVGMFGVFAGMGMGITATKYLAELRERDPARAGRILGISYAAALASGLIMAVTLLASSHWLASHTLAAPSLAPLLEIGTILLVLSTVGGVQNGALAGLEDFKSIAKSSTWAGATCIPCLVGGVYWWGALGAIYGLCVNAAFGCLITHFYLRARLRESRIRVDFRGCWQEIGVLWRFSLPALLASAMVGPVTWGCNAILVNQPNGYAEMGLFNAANQWYTALLFLPAVLGQVMIPVLSERHGAQDHGRMAKLVGLCVAFNLLLVGPVVLLGVQLSGWLISWNGPGFSAGAATLAVTLVNAGVLSLQMPVGQFVIASGRVWVGLAMNVGWALLFVGSTLLLAHHGSVGLAWARLIATLGHSISTFAFVWFVLRRCWTKPGAAQSEAPAARTVDAALNAAPRNAVPPRHLRGRLATVGAAAPSLSFDPLELGSAEDGQRR